MASWTCSAQEDIRDFVRDVEKLATRFPGVNERTVIQTFWNGIHQDIRLRLIEWGVSTERTTFDEIVRKAMDLEARDEAYKRELQQTGTATLERKWGRFANRTDGPQPYRPATGNSGSGQRGKSDRVRANAVMPQLTAEQSRPQPE